MVGRRLGGAPSGGTWPGCRSRTMGSTATAPCVSCWKSWSATTSYSPARLPAPNWPRATFR
eukprot:2287144-Lingulodinium_polyedra.AAC.1